MVWRILWHSSTVVFVRAMNLETDHSSKIRCLHWLQLACQARSYLELPGKVSLRINVKLWQKQCQCNNCPKCRTFMETEGLKQSCNKSRSCLLHDLTYRDCYSSSSSQKFHHSRDKPFDNSRRGPRGKEEPRSVPLWSRIVGPKQSCRQAIWQQQKRKGSAQIFDPEL